MLTATSITTKDLRDNLSQVLEQVAYGNQSYLISKFGKYKALLTPYQVQPAAKLPTAKLKPLFGLWKGHKNIKSSTDWVNKIRNLQSFRQYV